MNLTIRTSQLDEPAVILLLNEHLQSMRMISPPESVHALDVAQLRETDVTFWCAWSEEDLLGCGALKQLTTTEGEIKSMRTAAAHRGRGVGRGLLDHLVHEARQRGYQRLSLETGSQAEFEPARRMYIKAGFTEYGPFAHYREDPNSVFMTKLL
jgi:putative acetyltransferase